MFKRKFFFEAGDGGEGGGSGEDNQQQNQEPVIPDEIQKELAELREFKKSVAEKQPDLTPEQLAKNQEIEKAEFRKFSIERDFLKDEDFTTFENVKQQKDADLVFGDFEKEFKEKNPDAEPDDVKEAFNKAYNLDSENEVLKNRGLKLIEREAKELRAPFESKYKTAQDTFKQEKEVAASVPEFNKFIDEIVKEYTPDKLLSKVKDGEGDSVTEVDVDIELTKEQKEEIEKVFKNQKTFYQFFSNKDKRDDLKSAIAKKIDGYIKINNFDKATQRSFDVGKGIGVKNGSNVGAEQPFALKTGGQGPDTGKNNKQSLEESNQKIADARKRARR